MFVDVTPEVERRIAAGVHDVAWHGHLWDNAEGLAADSVHRPQDLRASGLAPPLPAPAGGLAAGARFNCCVLHVVSCRGPSAGQRHISKTGGGISTLECGI